MTRLRGRLAFYGSGMSFAYFIFLWALRTFSLHAMYNLAFLKAHRGPRDAKACWLCSSWLDPFHPAMTSLHAMGRNDQ